MNPIYFQCENEECDYRFPDDFISILRKNGEYICPKCGTRFPGLTIFLSGTSRTKYIYEIVSDKLKECGYEICWYKDEFRAVSNNALKDCFYNLKQSDRVILTIGRDFGHVYKNKGYTITEEEYKRAVNLGKRIIIFIEQEVYENQSNIDQRILGFIQKVKRENKWNFSFDKAKEIAQKVIEKWGCFTSYIFDEKKRISDLSGLIEETIKFLHSLNSKSISTHTLDEVKKRVYFIWNSNDLEIEHFNNLGEFLTEIENYYGINFLSSLIHNKKQKFRTFLIEEDPMSKIKDSLLFKNNYRILIFKTALNEKERDDFYESEWVPIVNEKIQKNENDIVSLKAMHEKARGYDKYYGKAKKEEIISLYEQALEGFKEYNDLLEVASIHIDLGNFLRRSLKQYEKAKTHIEKAEHIIKETWKETREHELLYAYCLNIKGLIHYSFRIEDDLNKAYLLCKKSKKIKNKWKMLNSVAESENALGIILIELGKIQENAKFIEMGLYYLIKALKYRKKIDNFRGSAQQCRNLGLAYFLLISLNPSKKTEYFDLAKDYFQQSLKYWNKYGKNNPPEEELCEIFYRLGELHSEYGSKTAAIEYLTQSEMRLRTLGDWNKRARCLDLLLKVYFVQKNSQMLSETIQDIINLYSKTLKHKNIAENITKNKFKTLKSIFEHIKKYTKNLNFSEQKVKEIDESFEKFTNFFLLNI